MNAEFPYLLYYLGLFITVISVSRFILKKYIQFSNKFNLIKSQNSRLTFKGLIFSGAGVVYAAVIMLAALSLDNLDFVQFSNFSPVIATSILVAILGFYNDFIDTSQFSKFIILTFLILMLLYSNATLPIIQNLNGFFGIYKIGFTSGLIITYFVYIILMSVINFMNRLEGYVSIFSIFFFSSLLYNNDINQFYTLTSIAVIIIGCSLVLINYNLSKRKNLLLGYSGSLFIGFWIITYLITYITSAPLSKLVNVYSIQIENIPIIAISMIFIPILDAFRVSIIRILNNKYFHSVDENQLHHILKDTGMTNLRASLFLTIINWFNCIVIFLIEPKFKSKELTYIYIFMSLFWLIFFEYLKRKNINLSKG